MGERFVILYHFVWATKMREPMILPAMESLLWDKLHRKGEELGIEVLALNGMPDHVHLVCDLPTKIAAAQLIKHLKGSSSHFINHLPNRNWTLFWQDGYSARTFSPDLLPRVVRYVERQKERHAARQIWPALERTEDPTEL